MLSAKGFEVFLPLYESTRRWKDRRKVLSLPLFPCYLFVRGGLDRKLQVVTTPGVHMILYRGEQVAMIPEQEIEAIQRAVDWAIPRRAASVLEMRHARSGYSRSSRRSRGDIDSQKESMPPRSFRGHACAVGSCGSPCIGRGARAIAIGQSKMSSASPAVRSGQSGVFERQLGSTAA